MNTQFITDFVKIVSDTKTIPKDRQSTKDFLDQSGHDLVDLVFDGIDTFKPSEFHAMAPEEVQKIALAAIPVEKIGDGKILAWLQSVNWAQLIQTVIAFIPKG